MLSKLAKIGMKKKFVSPGLKHLNSFTYIFLIFITIIFNKLTLNLIKKLLNNTTKKN